MEVARCGVYSAHGTVVLCFVSLIVLRVRFVGFLSHHLGTCVVARLLIVDAQTILDQE